VQTGVCPLAHSDDDSLRRKPRARIAGTTGETSSDANRNGNRRTAVQLIFDESWQSVAGTAGGSDLRRKSGFNRRPNRRQVKAQAET
jgi:hypothetical protein